MDVYSKGTLTVLACALLLAATAVPLVLRRVPRNRIYGFRTRATLADDRLWADANAHFGRGLLVASLVSAVAVLALRLVDGLAPAVFLNGTVVALVAPSLLAVLATLRFVRTRSRRETTTPGS